jgi:UDP-N-acetylmuramate--alanine ligase
MKALEAEHIYFLGIGGIGMSALARFFHLKGKKVSGYDRAPSVVTRSLEALGITVYYELDPQRAGSQEFVIYTPAIKSDNPERAAIDSAGIPMMKRSQILGEISKSFKTLAVAGTHGKTTTTSMMTHILREAGLDVTAFLGGISLNLNSNFVFGESDWMVVEADEYDRSFLTLHPEWTVFTSLDPDHLDIYGSSEEMENTYMQFAGQSRKLLVQEKIQDKKWPITTLSYGYAGDYKVSNLRADGLKTRFDFEWKAGSLRGLELNMPGEHNVMNMSAVLSLAIELGLPVNKLERAVATFKGIYRRFEVHHHSENLTYVDDYAHHPGEIEAVIATARHLFPNRKLTVVFQPHLFSRTRDFLQGFADELSKADEVILLEIYPAREKPIAGVNSQALWEKMSLKNRQLVQKTELVHALEKMGNQAHILMTLGAGDIDREVEAIRNWAMSRDKIVEGD